MIALDMAYQQQSSIETDMEIAGLVLIDTPYPVVSSATGFRAIAQSVLPASSCGAASLVKSAFLNCEVAVDSWSVPGWQCSPPPTTLLRAADHVPIKACTLAGDGPARIDAYRMDRFLGWGNNVNDTSDRFEIELVLDIQGHHFSIFAPENVSFRVGTAASG